MKFTYSWLLEYLDTNASPKEIADKLTALGLEVEEFTDLGQKYAPFIIAEIKAAAKHPNADKLQVCTVNTGSETLQIVCGAPNARAGIKVVLAPVGANIPNGNFQIKKSKIRDVESNGMLCSAAELELSDDSEGIIELDEKAPVGEKYADFASLNDSFYEINITPNRADCLGVYGIARDLAAAGIGRLKPLPQVEVKANGKSPISVSSQTYFIGRYISGVKNSQSPAWLKKRLQSIGLTPISVLVDITNYFTFSFGRPLHVYDADKLNGNLKVEVQKNKTKFNALNNKSYEIENDLVVADDKGPVALAGVIGNVESSVDENTKNILLEIAYFNPDDVARSGRHHLIDSDARYRFERGLDPEFMDYAADAATKLITELAGGKAAEKTSSGEKPKWQREINFEFARLKTFGGLEIPQTEAEKILSNLGFKINASKITPPSWRLDVEGSADIIEEILRVYGYDKVPLEELPFKSAPQPQQFGMNIYLCRNALVGRGLMQCVTYSFMKTETAAKFGGGKKELQLLNPISVELSEMRPSILPNLLEAAEKNSNRGFKNSALFEIGPVFSEKEQLVIAGIRAGKNNERNIYSDHRNIDAFDAKADLISILKAANAPEGRIQAEAPNYYHPGRSGGIYLGKTCLGYFGEIHPRLVKSFGLSGPVAAFEAFLANLPLSPKKYKKLEISDYQSVSRDFAFVLDEMVNSDDLIAIIKKADANIDNVSLFDIYSGDKIEKGKKSIALSIYIQPKAKTLTDSEIEAISAKVTAAAQQKFNAQLRA